ncbi:MAG TPA: DUF1266 domain-containing protein [Pyrinomonadaceae bacterium]|jgi:hypothetical protein
MKKIFLCLALISLSISTSCSFFEKIPINTEGVQFLSKEQKIWALAASAILAEGNNEPHVIISRERSEEYIQGYRRLLDRTWGIRNRSDLVRTLDWIDQGGHRAEFERMGAQIADLDEQQYKTTLARYQDDLDIYRQIEVVRRYYRSLGSKSILAWDYCRYINLCRWAYIAGYITEDEAWAKIMPAARSIQQSFNSWQEMGEDYLIGREFWSYTETQKSGEKYRNIYQKLISDQSSPWHYSAWNLNLEVIGTK